MLQLKKISPLVTSFGRIPTITEIHTTSRRFCWAVNAFESPCDGGEVSWDEERKNNVEKEMEKDRELKKKLSKIWKEPMHQEKYGFAGVVREPGSLFRGPVSDFGSNQRPGQPRWSQLLSNQGWKEKSHKFKTELCRPYVDTGRCMYGSNCQYAHGVSDLRNIQRHTKYKTSICINYHYFGYCRYNSRCNFIHKVTLDNIGIVVAQDIKLSPLQYSRLDCFKKIAPKEPDDKQWFGKAKMIHPHKEFKVALEFMNSLVLGERIKFMEHGRCKLPIRYPQWDEIDISYGPGMPKYEKLPFLYKISLDAGIIPRESWRMIMSRYQVNDWLGMDSKVLTHAEKLFMELLERMERKRKYGDIVKALSLVKLHPSFQRNMEKQQQKGKRRPKPRRGEQLMLEQQIMNHQKTSPPKVTMAEFYGWDEEVQRVNMMKEVQAMENHRMEAKEVEEEQSMYSYPQRVNTPRTPQDQMIRCMPDRGSTTERLYQTPGKYQTPPCPNYDFLGYCDCPYCQWRRGHDVRLKFQYQESMVGCEQDDELRERLAKALYEQIREQRVLREKQIEAEKRHRMKYVRRPAVFPPSDRDFIQYSPDLEALYMDERRNGKSENGGNGVFENQE